MTDSGSRKRGRENFDVSPKKKTIVTFVVEGRKIKACKEHLMEHSKYFETMFNGAFLESEMAEIPLNNRSVEEFQFFLNLLNQENCLSEDNIEMALELGDFYEAPGVMEYCVRWLKRQRYMYKERFELAMQYGLEEVKEHVLSEQVTVNQIQSVLPPDMDKSTLEMVLKRIFGLFSIEPLPTEEDVRAKSKDLDSQLNALWKKKLDYCKMFRELRTMEFHEKHLSNHDYKEEFELAMRENLEDLKKQILSKQMTVDQIKAILPKEMDKGTLELVLQYTFRLFGVLKSGEQPKPEELKDIMKKLDYQIQEIMEKEYNFWKQLQGYPYDDPLFWDFFNLVTATEKQQLREKWQKLVRDHFPGEGPPYNF